LKNFFFTVEFKKQTEEKLQKKLESDEENRERDLQAKVEKAKTPIEKGLANVQQNLAKLEYNNSCLIFLILYNKQFLFLSLSNSYLEYNVLFI
jgi:hypothetical protein